MNSPAQGKLVPSGLACGDTEHSLPATVNQAIFTNASFPLSFAFFFAFFFKRKRKKEITIQTLPWPNLALLRKGNFPEPPSTNLEA